MAASTKTPAENPADQQLMEFSVDQEALLTEVLAGSRTADGRATQPILSHIRLEATAGGVLTIAATDLKRTLKSECPAEVKQPGMMAVSAQKLSSYLKLLPKGKVGLKALPNLHLQLNAGSSRTRMPGRSATEFPAMQDSAAEPVSLSTRALKTILRQSLFAVATGEDRYLLNAALLLLYVDRMGMVATDGHRLSLVEMVEDDAMIEGSSKTLLPRECMMDLLSLLGATKEE